MRTTRRKTIVFVVIFFLVGPYFVPSILRVQENAIATVDVARATVHDWHTPEANTPSGFSAPFPSQLYPPIEQSSVTPNRNINPTTVLQSRQYEFASTSSGSNFYWVGASDSNSADLSNSGVRSEIQVISTQVSNCLDFWIADEAFSGIWGQVGYYICNGSTPISFYQIWNLTSNTVLNSGTASVSTGYHQFSMYSQNGGNTWAYALDGTVFGTYNMAASISSSSYPIYALSEEGYVSSPYNPPQAKFSIAIQILKSGGWYSAPKAAEALGCGTSSQSCWGVAGNLQDPSVPANSMVVGGSTLPLNTGTVLWDSPIFTLKASPTVVTVLAGVTGTSTITVAAANGFAGTVNMSSMENATGLTCTLSRTSVSLNSTTTSATSTLSCIGNAGTYEITVTGIGGTTTASTTVSYTVQDFTITASTTSLNVNSGATSTSTITVTPQEGFIGAVTLTVMTNSSNLVCRLSSTTITGGYGTSTLSCKGASAGDYDARIAGTSGTLTHSASVVFDVQDFTMTAYPTNVTASAGTAAISNVTVSPVNGFVGMVALAVATNSTNLVCTLSSTSITGGAGSSALSCSGSSSGNYIATVTGTSGTMARSVIVTYTVANAQTDFTVTESQTSVEVSAGVTGTSTITVAPINGFTGNVTLASSVSPNADLTCTLSVTSITLTSSQTSTLSCSGAAGIFNITVTGTSGAVSHSATVTYRIQDFTISASPASLRANTSAPLTSRITVSVIGFNGTVTLTDTVSQSSAMACSLTRTAITGGSGTSTIFCSASVSGSFIVTVEGTLGSLTHSITLTYTYSTSNATTQSSLYEWTVGSAALVLVLAVALNKRRTQVPPGRDPIARKGLS